MPSQSVTRSPTEPIPPFSTPPLPKSKQSYETTNLPAEGSSISLFSGANASSTSGSAPTISTPTASALNLATIGQYRQNHLQNLVLLPLARLVRAYALSRYWAPIQEQDVPPSEGAWGMMRILISLLVAVGRSR